MLRMCVLTVSGDRYSRAAMACRSSPLTIICSTSRSRSVSCPKSWPSGSENGSCVAASTIPSRPAGNHVPPSTAARTAVTTCSAGPSFETKPIAPAWIALIAVAVSQ
jgi:hypothetical protein